MYKILALKLFSPEAGISHHQNRLVIFLDLRLYFI